MWNDEGLSYYVAIDGFHQAIDRISRDVHAPLYYILLSFVLKIFHGEFGLRIISAVSAMITLVFVYLSARILLGGNVALLAAMLFAISPDNLDWARYRICIASQDSVPRPSRSVVARLCSWRRARDAGAAYGRVLRARL